MGLRRRWSAFVRTAGGRGDAPGVFDELDRRYRESGRHYHTWRHVAACLRELRRARPAGRAALELALWFHDAVYEPGRPDNEERSAALASRRASELGLAGEIGSRAAGLILATRHEDVRAGPASAEEALIRDIDLAVLGAPWAAYLRYERRIAREYSGLPAERFRQGRARLLRGLLARPAIYATPSFRKRLERRARRNLLRAALRLERQAKSGRR